MLGVYRYYILQVHPYLNKGTKEQRASAKRLSKYLSNIKGKQYHLTVKKIDGRKTIILNRYNKSYRLYALGDILTASGYYKLTREV